MNTRRLYKWLPDRSGAQNSVTLSEHFSWPPSSRLLVTVLKELELLVVLENSFGEFVAQACERCKCAGTLMENGRTVDGALGGLKTGGFKIKTFNQPFRPH